MNDDMMNEGKRGRIIAGLMQYCCVAFHVMLMVMQHCYVVRKQLMYTMVVILCGS